MGMQKVKPRVLLTGGHAASTAIATVQEIKKRKKGCPWDLYWVGSKKAMEGKKIPTLESLALPNMGIKCFSILSGRLQRKFSLWTIPSLVKIPLSFMHALLIIKKCKPNIIVSFGGYAAFPIVAVGKLLGISVVIHEQTAVAGRANKLSVCFAKKIALARKTSLDYFPKEKCVMVGNPIMKQIWGVRFKKRLKGKPVVYFTGGSRGAIKINDLVEAILDELLGEFAIIHHTGFIDYVKFQKIKVNLPPSLKDKYELHSRLNPMSIDEVFDRADIIVSRAGANTVAEIIASKRPAILIPLPIAYLNEQKMNAEFARKFGIASVLDQENLDGKKLLREIRNVKKRWNQVVAGVENKKSPDQHASENFVDLIGTILK
jgi:UDP-N-acetylglucosamine--N-acetylmuramyl-(pentapeptide) pyrophosphoryl-undecaprenol N-acetylglucosamine transferase